MDEEAAHVVKRIFQGVIEGKPLAQIGEELTAERILTPAAHWRAIGERVSMGASGADPYKWATATLIQILKKEEYMGWTVLNKTATESYKSKKREATPQENRLIFKDTHPAIVDGAVPADPTSPTMSMSVPATATIPEAAPVTTSASALWKA